MQDENPELTATARALLSRRQQKQVLTPLALWLRIVEDVRALALSSENETALLHVLYGLIFQTRLD